ncbi:hypothetical protein B0T17DRAFT_501983 [Bombardia bombarda]|uniref:N-acetyltransferase domain-containing protein n=1 Tax=Bombardia bombarda TaxID=252184 RepID=A0AA39XJA0_9PEZI|nr:hypothetical protein B0T17DRAFT_501983 [Bombardia bombarda]
MVVCILPCLVPDIRQVYNAYFSAFGNEKMGALMLEILFPGSDVNSEEFRDEHAKGTLAWWHSCEHQYTWKALDMDTNTVVGMALADVYSRPRTAEERKNEGVPWLEGAQKERAEAVLNPLWEMRESLFGGASYIYAHVIGVDPKYQGRQAGAKLCQFGIHMCEESALPIYFEASPSSIGLYEKLGYERLKETIVHKAELMGTPEDIVVPLVVRMPSQAKGMTFYEWKAQGYPSFGSRAEGTKI